MNAFDRTRPVATAQLLAAGRDRCGDPRGFATATRALAEEARLIRVRLAAAQGTDPEGGRHA